MSSFFNAYVPFYIDSVALTQIAQAQPMAKNVLVASVYVEQILNAQEQHPFVDQLLQPRLQPQIVLHLVMYVNISYFYCQFYNFNCFAVSNAGCDIIYNFLLVLYV